MPMWSDIAKFEWTDIIRQGKTLKSQQVKHLYVLKLLSEINILNSETQRIYLCGLIQSEG